MIRKLPVKRNGAFVPIEVPEMVPGDIVFLRGGNVVPADAQLPCAFVGSTAAREPLFFVGFALEPSYLLT